VSSFVAMAVALLAFVDPASAQTTGPLLTADGLAGLGIAIAAFGGAMGQGRAISAALEAIGRNPGAAGQMFLPWLLALVLIESLVIYAFVIALKLVGLI
ncbi:MAG: ATP synthase F0 subunit C, partial [Bdellovibrionales bacterium]|nr:ATP synthase F0 subunit C [Bdellovibrionales bacterium]